MPYFLSLKAAKFTDEEFEMLGIDPERVDRLEAAFTKGGGGHYRRGDQVRGRSDDRCLLSRGHSGGSQTRGYVRKVIRRAEQGIGQAALRSGLPVADRISKRCSELIVAPRNPRSAR